MQVQVLNLSSILRTCDIIPTKKTKLTQTQSFIFLQEYYNMNDLRGKIIKELDEFNNKIVKIKGFYEKRENYIFMFA